MSDHGDPPVQNPPPLIYVARDPGLPEAFNGCTCSCHHTPGMMHCVPCCYPAGPT